MSKTWEKIAAQVNLLTDAGVIAVGLFALSCIFGVFVFQALEGLFTSPVDLSRAASWGHLIVLGSGVALIGYAVLLTMSRFKSLAQAGFSGISVWNALLNVIYWGACLAVPFVISAEINVSLFEARGLFAVWTFPAVSLVFQHIWHQLRKTQGASC